MCTIKWSNMVCLTSYGQLLNTKLMFGAYRTLYPQYIPSSLGLEEGTVFRDKPADSRFYRTHWPLHTFEITKWSTDLHLDSDSFPSLLLLLFQVRVLDRSSHSA